MLAHIPDLPPLSLQPQFAEIRTVAEQKQVSIPLYTTYNSPTQIQIWGRVLEAFDAPATPKDSAWRNTRRVLHALSSEDLAGVELTLRFQGQTYRVRSDEEGFFRLELRPAQPLSPGLYPVLVQLTGEQSEYQAAAALGQIVVYPQQEPSIGVVSDIDDTILQTGVTHKDQMLKTVFAHNATTLNPVPGMAEFYQHLEHAAGEGSVLYLSGSPLNLYSRLSQFLHLNRFPAGAITLRHWGLGQGTDSPFSSSYYKFKKLKALFETFPQRHFILIGDSGEHDPEIYRQIQQVYPKQVVGILIHNVTGAAATEARFDGQYLFDAAPAAWMHVQKMGWLSGH